MSVDTLSMERLPVPDPFLEPGRIRHMQWSIAAHLFRRSSLPHNLATGFAFLIAAKVRFIRKPLGEFLQFQREGLPRLIGRESL